jgi:hypothetical protein
MKNDKLPKELTKQEVLNYHSLTVGKLKSFIEKYNIPDNAQIVVQRVEDHYYENNGWGVYFKEGYLAGSAREHNKDVESGKFLDKEQYPLITEGNLKIMSEEDIKSMSEQYTPVESPVFYKEDSDILFLDLHY